MQPDLKNTVFYILILVLSVVIHEVAHGFMAYKEGDPTAKVQGRLTLNPLKHISLMGTIVFPLVIYFSTGLLFGWAKPVPYNPNNFRNRRRGTLLVASAGVLMNLLIALVFGLLIRVLPGITFLSGTAAESLLDISGLIVLVNIALAVFNLLPIPPLDGSRILFSLLPVGLEKYEYTFERYAPYFMIALILYSLKFGFNFLWPIIGGIFQLFTGSTL